MKKIKKRHIVLAALIVALAAAVYLNWQYSTTGSLIAPSSKELGEVTYVNANAKATEDELSPASKEQSQSGQYFAQMRTERQQTQDSVLNIAKETLTLTESDDEAREEAAEKLSKLEERMIAQTNIEGVLKAKGFSDCLCFISDEGCTVTVFKEEMQESSPLVIKDAVCSQYKIDFNDITIVDI